MQKHDKSTTMSFRVRHCVECPGCQTWYLIGFSPYKNGAHLVCTQDSSGEEYTLYCCAGAGQPSHWKWLEAKACIVAKSAHDRGYGSDWEIQPIKHGTFTDRIT